MTNDVIGVGIAGFWHVHAGDYARDATEHAGTRVVAGWDADPALAARARAAGVALVVSLPRLSQREIVAASSLVRSGALGTVTYARVRMAHDGWLGGWLPERFAARSASC